MFYALKAKRHHWRYYVATYRTTENEKPFLVSGLAHGPWSADPCSEGYRFLRVITTRLGPKLGVSLKPPDREQKPNGIIITNIWQIFQVYKVEIYIKYKLFYPHDNPIRLCTDLPVKPRLIH